MYLALREDGLYLGELELLDLVDADGDCVGGHAVGRRRNRPHLSRAPIDLGEHAQRLEGVMGRERAQEGGRVVDEEGWARRDRKGRRAAKELAGDARARHFLAQHGRVLIGKAAVGREKVHLIRRRLCLQGEAHERDGVVARGRRAERPQAVALVPSTHEVILHYLGLALDRQLVEHGKRANKRVEHRVRELEHKLLGAAEGRRLGAGEVGEPVHKVEGHVGRLHALAHHHLLELCKERRWRRLALHEPAVVEAHLTLREADRLLVVGRLRGARRQRLRTVIEHIRQRDVMIVDHVARLEVLVRCVLGCDDRQECLHLHHVVERREGEHGHGACGAEFRSTDLWMSKQSKEQRGSRDGEMAPKSWWIERPADARSMTTFTPPISDASRSSMPESISSCCSRAQSCFS